MLRSQCKFWTGAAGNPMRKRKETHVDGGSGERNQINEAIRRTVSLDRLSRATNERFLKQAQKLSEEMKSGDAS